MELYIEGVTEIKNYEYSRYNEITSLKMSGEVKKIGLQAFSGCLNLKVVELGEGVETIDVCAFKDTKAVIYVPKSIKRIEYNAFSKDDVVFFECGENDFRGHYEVIRSEDYPDSYYRGPSMGVDEQVNRYYEDGATLLFNKTHQDFLGYIKEHN